MVSGIPWQNYYRALDDLLRWMSWYLEMKEKSKRKYSMVLGRSSHTHSSLHLRLTEEPWVTSQTVCKRFVTHTLPSNTLWGQLPDGQCGECIQGWNGILWSKMQGELWTEKQSVGKQKRQLSDLETQDWRTQVCLRQQFRECWKGASYLQKLLQTYERTHLSWACDGFNSVGKGREKKRDVSQVRTRSTDSSKECRLCWAM